MSNTRKPTHRLITSTPVLVAVLVGCSIPALVFGRTAVAVTVGLAFILTFFLDDWRQPWKDVRRAIVKPIGIWIVITLSLWTISAIGSSDPVRSLEAVTRTGGFALIAVLLWSVLKSNPANAGRAQSVFVAGVSVSVVIALLSSTVLPQLYWVTHFYGWRDQPLLTELKSFAALSVLIIPMLILAFVRISGWWRWLCVLNVLGIVAIVFMTDNRAAIAGLLAAFAIGIVALAIRIRNRLLGAGLIAGMFVVCAAVVVWLYYSRQHLQNIAPDQDWLFPVWLLDFERQVIWGHTWKQAMAAPLFGLGANTVNFSPGADTVIPGTSHLTLIPGHPHNWFFEIMAETGIVGLLSLLVSIGFWFYQLLIRFYEAASSSVLAALAIAAGYWGSGLFNFSYWSAWWQMAFFVAVALVFAWEEPDRT